MFVKKWTLVITSVILIFISFRTVKAQKSVFIISKHQLPSQAQAYSIDGNDVILQGTVDISTYNPGNGAVGNAVWPQKELMFVTYENSPMIVWASTKSLEKVGEFDTYVTDLSGIAVDENKEKIYIVRRNNDDLYVFLFDEPNNTLVLDDQYDLNTPSGNLKAWGLALDEKNDLLYVSTDTKTVHVYDTNDWSYDHYIDIEVDGTERPVVGIAVDPNRGYLYTGDWDGHHYLVRTMTSSPYTSIEVEIEGDYYSQPLIGVDVDEETGLVYCTTYHNDFRVYDSNLSLQDTEVNDIYRPAGVAVGGLYKPPAFYLEKVDVNEPNCVLPGDYITYKITYGPNGLDHNNVVITDYLPCQVDYINLSDPNYDDVNHTYKWQIGSLSASAPNDFVTLTVCVNFGVEPNGIITNYCEIESDQYLSSASADTSACFWSPDILYVDVNAVGCNSGMSWEHADPDLQSALQKAQAWDVNQIWVAKGTYKPTMTSDRAISFELLDDVAIYGGFPPGGGTWTERNPNTYETILSGDIGMSDYWYDNSYHVVKCVDVNNATLDGFTITAGNAKGSGDNMYGGGIYDYNSSSLMITNCTFSGNSARFGGGMYNEQSSPTLINCTFSGNSATSGFDNYGGAICNWYYSNPNITNCIFSNNSSRDGGAVYNYYSNPNITFCVFTDNDAVQYGGGLCNENSTLNVNNSIFTGNFLSLEVDSCGAGIHNYQSSATIDNCIFSGNISDYGCGISNYQSSTTTKITNCIFNGNHANVFGGGVYNIESSPALIDCVFSGNWAGYGGAICNYDYSGSNITNCTFSNNSANEGGGVYNNFSDPNISNCVFSGNDADNFGGGIVNCYGLSPAITNCIFSGNYAGGGGGGGIGNFDQLIIVITNCTFSGNYASGNYGGGAMCNWESDPLVTNCILWENEADTVYDEIYIDGSSNPDISYSDIKGGWTGGTGNKDEDPCFFEVDPDVGSWTADASYDSSTFQSTLTDDYASWTVNQLAGKFINPDSSQKLHFFIVSNDDNTINVWSDVESFVISGDPYQIYDYHLKVESACIDAGYPQGDYTGWKDIDGEPRVFDGDYNDTEIVDMGADEYYWSPADFNSDGLVNFFDYALIANVWLTTPAYQYYNDVYDLIDNDYIDSNDLARFCEDWLWQTAWAKTFPFAYYQAMGRGMGKSMAESPDLTQELFTSVSARQPQPELNAADIEEIIKWLEELWLTEDQLRKIMTADDWLKFIESVENSK